MSIFKLFRIKNLLLTALIQSLIYYAIITPTLNKFTLPSLLPSYCFWLIVLATILITAGGYVINDYFDIKIDRINKPERIVVGDTISKENAMMIYYILTIVGVLLGLVVSFLIKSISLGFIFLAVPGMLWFYSSTYKRQFMIGNLIVALCCSLVPLTILVAESQMQLSSYGDLIRQTSVLQQLCAWVCGYAGFIFITTLIREIVKDLQDVEGDRQMECRTMPIVWGKRRTNIVLWVLSFVLIIGLGWFEMTYFKSAIKSINSQALSIFSPLNITIIFLIFVLTILWTTKKKGVDIYSKLSNYIKLFMLITILYSFVFYYIWAKTYNLSMFGLFYII